MRPGKIRSAEVRTDSDARRWEARLNREWSQRPQVAAWIATQIKARSPSSSRVVELACGAGFLAEFLGQELLGVHYCGFDLSPHLLKYARRRFNADRGRLDEGCMVEFRCAELLSDDWVAQLDELGWAGKVDAIVSIQALHDLGELAQQKQVLKQARKLLRVGGVLAYGDLLFDAENPHPTRYSKDEHEEMLHACGFSISGSPSFEYNCGESGTQGFDTAGFGEFGCFACRK